MKVLDSGSRPLDSGFQLSGFRNPYHHGFRIPYLIVDSGFQTIVDSGFQSSGFRIPTAKICWIPDSLTWGEKFERERAERTEIATAARKYTQKKGTYKI